MFKLIKGVLDFFYSKDSYNCSALTSITVCFDMFNMISNFLALFQRMVFTKNVDNSLVYTCKNIFEFYENTNQINMPLKCSFISFLCNVAVNTNSNKCIADHHRRLLYCVITMYIVLIEYIWHLSGGCPSSGDAQNQQMGKPNNLKVFDSKDNGGPEHDSRNLLRSP